MKTHSHIGNIHIVIRDLQDRAADLPDEQARVFVDAMHKRLGECGDKFFATPKQLGYLKGLKSWLHRQDTERQAVNGENEPLTGLALLRAKRAKLISSMAKHQFDTTKEVAAGRKAYDELPDISPVTAKMRHNKSLNRQLFYNPLLVTQTKR